MADEYVYGMNPVYEALHAGRRRVTRMYCDARLRGKSRISHLTRLAEEKGVECAWVEKGRLIDMSTSREHQGVVLACEPYRYADISILTTASRVLMIDNVEDPHNVGALIRTAECLGYECVLLPLKGAPGVYPSVVKASAGATEHMAIIREGNMTAYVRALREAGLSMVVLDMKGAVDLLEYAAHAPSRLALVIGGEGAGVGHYVVRQADAIVSIPHSGQINSLNASVAGALAMFALRK